jgi:hypothetical protein
MTGIKDIRLAEREGLGEIITDSDLQIVLGSLKEQGLVSDFMGIARIHESLSDPYCVPAIFLKPARNEGEPAVLIPIRQGFPAQMPEEGYELREYSLFTTEPS